jgi:negative regulator of flagellin synthesis FlgM
MDVSKTRGIKGTELSKTETVTKQVIKSEKLASESNDAVTLSGEGQEVARLAAKAQSLPDVRSEKVTAVQNAIESGTYKIEGKKVAEKLLREVIVDTTV